MPKVWRFLSEGARALDVQVCATTHSKDCLDAIAYLHAAAPELAAETSVYRLEQERANPVRLEAGRVADYLRLELEAR